jgi:RNA polymerase sigma factor (sigma-70 family)
MAVPTAAIPKRLHAHGLPFCCTAATNATDRSRQRAYPFSDRKRSNALGKSRLGVGVDAPDNRSFVASIAARYGTRLRRFLSVRLRNAADVPDLAQEVFLRLLRVDGYESIRSPEAYLFTIASHVIHQHAVRRSSEPVSVDVAEVFSELRTASSDDPADQVAQAQRLDELERMLAHLPTRVATALVLHRVAGYSVQEVGDELGVSRETAKKYLARAVEHCRNLRATQNAMKL